jgi:hypothetical protein
MTFNPFKWYWTVPGHDGQVWSSAAGAYISVDDEDYQAFLAQGDLPSAAVSEERLIAYLREQNVPPYHRVPTRLIVDRLNEVGKLAVARAALDAADLYTRERWNNRQEIYADDLDARGLLHAIAADPDVILAPA